MHYQINPMTDHGIGAEVLGVDLTHPVSEALPSTSGETQFVGMHQANGDCDMNEVRRLHRIMIKARPIAGETVTEAERHAVAPQRVPAILNC